MVLPAVWLAPVATVSTSPDKELWTWFLEMKGNYLHFGRLREIYIKAETGEDDCSTRCLVHVDPPKVARLMKFAQHDCIVCVVLLCN
jgi:hypothetical protein